MVESITCPRCHRTSHHPVDVREGYCAACHDWTSLRLGVPVFSQERSFADTEPAKDEPRRALVRPASAQEVMDRLHPGWRDTDAADGASQERP